MHKRAIAALSSGMTAIAAPARADPYSIE
jgi:hypothetical protein